MSDRRSATMVAVERTLVNNLPTQAAAFCAAHGLSVELEVPLATFAAEMVHFGVKLAKAVRDLDGGAAPAELVPA